MKRSRLQEASMEVTVGAFMFMVLLALGFFTIVFSRENIFSKSYEVEVRFQNVTGLREGDNVFLRGVHVGKIKEIRLEPDGVHLMATIEQPVTLHEDYRIEILPSSVLGGRYLNIYEGAQSAPLLASGREVIGTPPVDLIDEATKTAQMIKKALEQGGILENLEVAMTQVREFSTKLNSGEGTLSKLLTDEEMYDDLKAIATNLEDISGRMADGKGTMGRLLSEDDQLYDNLLAASEVIKTIMVDVEHGDGTIGKLVKDDALYEEIRMLVADIRAAVDDLRETTPIATFASIFFGAL